MPHGYKDAGTLAVEISMSRMVHAGAFLLVEGVDDVRFWRIYKHDNCEIVDGEGKQNVIGAVKRLNDEPLDGVLGVVDDDFDSLLGVEDCIENLVAVDAHDLECLLCRSGALERVLALCGNEAKIRRFEISEGRSVRTALLNKAMQFGKLRWAITRDRLDVEAKIIKVNRFVSRDTWNVESERLVREVARGDENVKRDLEDRVAELPGVEPWRVVRGHDVLDLLRIGLMQVLGEMNTNTSRAELFRLLCAAVTIEELQCTQMWKEICEWKAENQMYPVLKE